jgi:C4-type Zn-finger protein
MRSKIKDDGPAIVVCERCGHRATTRARGFPALGASDLHGKVLRCSACGYRQTYSDPATMEAERKAVMEAIAEAYRQAPPLHARH